MTGRERKAFMADLWLGESAEWQEAVGMETVMRRAGRPETNRDG
jgi:hypothetical protein